MVNHNWAAEDISADLSKADSCAAIKRLFISDLLICLPSAWVLSRNLGIDTLEEAGHFLEAFLAAWEQMLATQSPHISVFLMNHLSVTMQVVKLHLYLERLIQHLPTVAL